MVQQPQPGGNPATLVQPVPAFPELGQQPAIDLLDIPEEDFVPDYEDDTPEESVRSPAPDPNPSPARQVTLPQKRSAEDMEGATKPSSPTKKQCTGCVEIVDLLQDLKNHMAENNKFLQASTKATEENTAWLKKFRDAFDQQVKKQEEHSKAVRSLEKIVSETLGGALYHRALEETRGRDVREDHTEANRRSESHSRRHDRWTTEKRRH